MKENQELTEFQIIKQSDPLKRTWKNKNNNPLYYRLKITLEKMEIRDKIVIPLNGIRGSKISYWVKSIEENINSKIIDPIMRHKNPTRFSKLLKKNEDKEEISMEIRRDN